MRKFLVLVMLTFSVQLAFGQQKQTTPAAKKPQKDSVKVVPGRIISTLSTFNGWVKQNNGKWSSSPNRIPYEDPDYNNAYYDQFQVGTENINQIRVMEMTVAGKSYYAMIIRYLKGYYKNPDEKTDWKYYYAADYYLLNKADFHKILSDSFAFGKPYDVSLRAYYAGTVPAADMSTVPGKIGKDINNNLRSASMYDTTVKTYFQFALLPIHDKRGRYIRFNTSLGYAKTGKQPAHAPLDVFKEQYYELPFDRFKLFVSAH